MKIENKSLDIAVVNESIGYLLRRASRRLREVTLPVLKDYGLSRLELTTLNLVEQNPNCILRTLAEAVAVEPPAMNRIMNNLEKNGLIARHKSETDARYTYFLILPAGLECVKMASPAVLSLEADVMDMLTDEEQCTLISVLQKLAD